MRLFTLLVAGIIALALAGEASAVVVEQPVTLAFLKEHPKAFSIKAANQDDGLIRFTITRHLSQPRYLVASFSVRRGPSVVAKSHFPSFAREESAIYHLVVSPKHLAGSEFQLSERSFSSAGGNPIPLPGGTDYKIKLEDFAPREAGTPND